MGLPATRTHRDADVDNTAQALATAAADLLTIHVFNANSGEAFIHFYDAATGSVTVGTTPPKLTFGVGPDRSVDIPVNADFGTAITYAATNEADGGATDPTTGLVLTATFRSA